MADKLRVLFAIGALSGGGAERQVVEILKHLDRTRFVPLLYLIFKEGELLPEVPADVPILAFWERHRRLRLKVPGVLHWLRHRDLMDVLREQQVDLLYDRTYLMTLITAGPARALATPRVAGCVDDPEAELPMHSKVCVRFSRWKARRAYRQAACVLANSDGLRQRLLKSFRLPDEHVRVQPNVLDLERIDRLSSAECSRFERTRFHIVSMGRLHFQKGYQYLLAALDEIVHRRNHPEVLWHLFGTGPFEGELRSMIAERKLGEHVRLEGFEPNPFPCLRAAQLFCLPSLNEGLPNVLIEAAACRVPILAADCPSGPREILDGGRLGTLVPPADAPALVEAIDDCLSNYPAWESRVAAARRHVEERYSLAAGMQRLESLLETVARSNMNHGAP